MRHGLGLLRRQTASSSICLLWLQAGRLPSFSRSAYSVHSGLYTLSFILRIFHVFLVAGGPAEQWHQRNAFFFFGWPHQLNSETKTWLSICALTLLLFLFTGIYKHHYLYHVLQCCVRILAPLCVCSVGLLLELSAGAGVSRTTLQSQMHMHRIRGSASFQALFIDFQPFLM